MCDLSSNESNVPRVTVLLYIVFVDWLEWVGSGTIPELTQVMNPLMTDLRHDSIEIECDVGSEAQKDS